jgi:hypothetical protein
MKFVYIVGLSSVVMAGALAEVETQRAHEQEQGAQYVPEKPEQKAVSGITKFAVRTPKKLLDPYMKLMNESLRINPTCTVRTEIACNIARKTLKEMPSLQEDKALIVGKVNSLLASLKQFFVQIHSFGFLIEPLLKESLVGDVQEKEKREQLEKLSVLLGFVKCEAHEKDLYFENHVQTKEALESVCAEFITFFGDLTESLSEDALKEYRKVREKFTKKSK